MHYPEGSSEARRAIARARRRRGDKVGRLKSKVWRPLGKPPSPALLREGKRPLNQSVQSNSRLVTIRPKRPMQAIAWACSSAETPAQQSSSTTTS